MTSTQPARSKGRRGTSPLLLLSVFLAVALAPLTAEASLPRSSLDATNSAALAGAEAVDSGQLLAANLQTPFALVAGDELEKALTCNPTPSVESLTSPEGARLEPPQLASRACDGSFTLHLEPVDFGLNPQRGPPLEIPDLHQGWFVADPKTRIGGVRLNPEDLIGGERHLNLGLYRGYLVGRPGLTEDEPPDPWGLVGEDEIVQVGNTLRVVRQAGETAKPVLNSPEARRAAFTLLQGGGGAAVANPGMAVAAAKTLGPVGLLAFGGYKAARATQLFFDWQQANWEADVSEELAAAVEQSQANRRERRRGTVALTDPRTGRIIYNDPGSPYWTQAMRPDLDPTESLRAIIQHNRWVEEKHKESTKPPAGRLHRPHVRKWVIDEVERLAPRAADGKFLDANTGEPIAGPYDLGHVRGREFWRERDKAEAEGLTQEEFNDRMNDPALYQIEHPNTNRSRAYEVPKGKH